MKREKIRLLSFGMILVLAILVITPLIVASVYWCCAEWPECNYLSPVGCDAIYWGDCYIGCVDGGKIDCYREPI